jgi:hypothetical protein
MSDFESFSPSENSEGVDAAALERLREQMKKASQQMKGDQQQEAKQKQKEDNLYEVLLAFVKKLGPGNKIVALISKCIANNISAEIILALIGPIFPTVQKLIGLEILPPASKVLTEAQTKELINPQISNSELPLHVRISLDNWIKAINSTSFKDPKRNYISIASKANPEKACGAFHGLIAFVAQEYLQREKVDFNPQNVLNFMSLFSDNLIQRLKMTTESTKEIETKEDADS